jgi:hypothetical protein
MIYFGCWDQTGHYLRRPDGQLSSKNVYDLMRREGIYPAIDGGFCPGSQTNPDGTVRRPERGPYQEEGWARLSHFQGWSILAFWDRSVDSRFGANSAFIEKDYWDFDAMVVRAKAAYPKVWTRFTFEVQLYESHTNRRA